MELTEAEQLIKKEKHSIDSIDKKKLYHESM